MKILRFVILILFAFIGAQGFSQITFVADTVDGCDSLEVNFEFSDFTGTVTSVDWDFGNGLTASGMGDQTVMYDTAGTYHVSVTINGASTLSKTETIRVHSSPRARFRWYDSLEMGSLSVVLVAARQPVDTVNYRYQWLFGDGTEDSLRAVIHNFPQAGEYSAFLRVTHPFGCMRQWSDVVSVRDSLDCPNVFTPNDDGVNDFFIVSSNGVTVYNMQIFSRSGIRVFEVEAPILIWDGRNLSGQELHPGTYYYVIRPAAGSGRFEKSGFVQLYR